MIRKVIMSVAAVLALSLPAFASQQDSSDQATGGSGSSSTDQPSQPSQGQASKGQASQGQASQGVAFENKASKQVIDQLRARTAEYQQAWNDGDVSKMASFYNSNSTYLSVSGQTATGKAEIQSLLQQEQSGPMKGTQTTLTLQSVRSLTPTIAILDVNQNLTGAQQPESGQQIPTEVHVSVVAMKQGSTWQIAALRAFPAPESQMNVGGSGQQQDSDQGSVGGSGSTGSDQGSSGSQTSPQGNTDTFPPSGSDLPPEGSSPQPLKR